VADGSAERPLGQEPRREPGEPGVRQVLVIGAVVVVIVLAAAVLTFVLPSPVQDLVFRTPLLILILMAGTAGVLWRITRPARPGGPSR
jgi:hypothetical protein